MKFFFCVLFIAIFAVVSGNAQNGVWQTLAPVPSLRQGVSTAVLNGKIYVIAGWDVNEQLTSTVEVYDSATNTWASAASLPNRNVFNNAAVAGGNLYTFGGISTENFRYNPGNNSWTSLAPSMFPHGQSAAVGVINDKIYVAGGYGAETMSGNELEVYDPLNNNWVVLAPMNTPRFGCAGGVIGGKFYVVGGLDASTVTTRATLEVYDPVTNTWTTLPSMPTARSRIAAAVVFGELWVFGGERPNLYGKVEIYNPVSNSWRTIRDMPTPRHSIWASVIGNKIYIPGGAGIPGFGPTNVNEVFIVANKNADFDGDGKTDLSVFRPSDGVWYQNRSSLGYTTFKWGISTDTPAPGDFDGDGRTDVAVFRPTADPAQPDFYIVRSSDLTFTYVSLGSPNDVPVVEDYDGDGKDDVAVYRQANNTWYVIKSSNGGLQTFSNITSGRPIAGDFDGDGKGDFTNFSTNFLSFYVARSGSNYQVVVIRTSCCGVGSIPFAADYDGDGKADAAVYTSGWSIHNSSTGGDTFISWGNSTDIPVPGDYDGDAKADAAIYRNGAWWLKRSTLGIATVNFGLSGDVPIPNRYLP